MTTLEDQLRTMMQTRALDVTGPPPSRETMPSSRPKRSWLVAAAAAAIVLLVAGLVLALRHRTHDVDPTVGCSTPLPGEWRRALDRSLGTPHQQAHALAIYADGRVVIDDSGSIKLMEPDGTLRNLATLDNPVLAQTTGSQIFLYTPNNKTITYLRPPFDGGASLDQARPVSKLYLQDGLAYLGVEHGLSGRPEIWIYHLDPTSGLRAERPRIVPVPDLSFFLAQPGYRIEESPGRFVYATQAARVARVLRSLPPGSDYTYSAGYWAFATPRGQLYWLAPNGTRRGPVHVPGVRRLYTEAAVGDYLVVGTDPEHRTGPVYVVDTTTGASTNLGVTRSSSVNSAVLAAHSILTVTTTAGLRVLDVSGLPHLKC